jgi:hypothetical protein
MTRFRCTVKDGAYRYDVEVEANTGTHAQKIVARRESKKLTEVYNIRPADSPF